LEYRYAQIRIILKLWSRAWQAGSSKAYSKPGAFIYDCLRQYMDQGFPTCDTRTTSGTRRSSRWYASNFHFSQKNWIHSFL